MASAAKIGAGPSHDVHIMGLSNGECCWLMPPTSNMPQESSHGFMCKVSCTNRVAFIPSSL